MLRRQVIFALIGMGGILWPLPLSAQKSGRRVIGVLGSANPAEWSDRLGAFRNSLSEAGFEEGRNLHIEYRWSDGDNARLPVLAAELVKAQVDLIAVLGSTLSAQAAKAATAKIPIVFRIAGDPVAVGLVASLNQPGGNVTGITTLGLEVAEKQLELLNELLPKAKTIALIVNPTNPALSQPQSYTLMASAQRRGQQLVVANASTNGEIDAAFAELARQRVDGLIIGADTFFNSRNEQIAQLAIRHAVPTISPYREFAAVGGLMSYGGSITDASRLAGVYAARILTGDLPRDLPVVQAVKIEAVINLKTAGAIGLSVPPIVLARADVVIE